jgi:RimJ/RimL family protein N-acetyltransferase
MLELWNRPITLSGNVVRLEPLSLEHVPALAEAGRDEEIWRYMLYGNLSGEERMRAWVAELLRRQASGTDLPFAVFQRESGRMAGCTRYLEMRPAQRGLEIGGTWYGPEFQRTAVNTECKLLLLSYAFETLGCIRVQFKADARNERSLRAIERLGAVKEGVLRNHMILEDGTWRDSVYYSILEREWPGVKAGLEARLRR